MPKKGGKPNETQTANSMNVRFKRGTETVATCQRPSTTAAKELSTQCLRFKDDNHTSVYSSGKQNRCPLSSVCCTGCSSCNETGSRVYRCAAGDHQATNIACSSRRTAAQPFWWVSKRHMCLYCPAWMLQLGCVHQSAINTC